MPYRCDVVILTEFCEGGNENSRLEGGQAGRGGGGKWFQQVLFFPGAQYGFRFSDISLVPRRDFTSLFPTSICSNLTGFQCPTGTGLVTGKARLEVSGT